MSVDRSAVCQDLTGGGHRGVNTLLLQRSELHTWMKLFEQLWCRCRSNELSWYVCRELTREPVKQEKSWKCYFFIFYHFISTDAYISAALLVNNKGKCQASRCSSPESPRPPRCCYKLEHTEDMSLTLYAAALLSHFLNKPLWKYNTWDNWWQM